MTSLNDVSIDAIYIILEYLPFHDLVQLAKVSKIFNYVCNQQINKNYLPITNGKIIPLERLLQVRKVRYHPHLEKFPDILPSLTHLDLSQCTLYGGELRKIGKIPKLKHLYLNTVNNEWPGVISEFSNLKNLTTFHIPNMEVGQLACKFIAKLTNLENLDIANNYINCITSFTNLTKLRYLNCRGNRIQKFSFLGSLNNLIRLNIGGCGLTNLPPEILNLSKLKFLSLYSSSCRWPETLDMLSKLELLELDLHGNTFDGTLGNISKLKIYSINVSYSNLFNSDYRALSSMKTLKKINIRGNYIDDLNTKLIFPHANNVIF